MTANRALILMLILQTVVMAHAQSPNLIGKWNVEITFANEDHRSLRFDAKGDGKGRFELLDPRTKDWGGATTSDAKWSRGEANSFTVSSAEAFMIGNFGRDAGT